MSEVVLHGYPLSPFTEKIKRVLAYKNLPWRDVEVPMVMPKPDFCALTGGYRRVPVLQVGADIYCDTRLIAARLEELCPDPTIFPDSAGGEAEMIADWADHRPFLWAVMPVFDELLPQLPQSFTDDRVALSELNRPENVKATAPHYLEQFKAFIALVDKALGKSDFICGREFSIADAACFNPVLFASQSAELSKCIDRYPAVVSWCERIKNFSGAPAGALTEQEAREIARAAVPQDVGFFSNADDPIQLDSWVNVSADDYGRENVRGRVVKVSVDEIAVQIESEGLGDLAVHFPRLGYRISVDQ